jgi:septum site-determining protein MinD
VVSITIASGKGGTGKTSIAVNLGIAMAQLGANVAVLDADLEMANVELHLGIEGLGANLHKVMTGEAEIEDVVFEGPYNLKIIPAGICWRGLERFDLTKIKEVFREITDLADILIIDSPSGLGKCTLAAIELGEETMLIVTPEVSSMSDALKTKIVASKLGSHVLGSVLNRATSQDELTALEISKILELPVLATIPEDPEMRKSLAMGEPVLLRAPNSPSAMAIRKLAADLIGVKLEEDKKSLLSRFLQLFERDKPLPRAF